MCHFIEVEPAAWRIIRSIKNHSWYLDQEIVIMCLASEDLDNFERVEKVAKKLFKTSKGIISTERVRAEVPDREFYSKCAKEPPSLAIFVKSESWLIFDILGLRGDEVVWLSLLRSFWSSFSGFRKFPKFVWVYKL